jgi:hypothetical protein
LLARILTKQKSPEAEEAWHALIEHNADSYESYREYFASQGISLGKPFIVLPFVFPKNCGYQITPTLKLLKN